MNDMSDNSGAEKATLCVAGMVYFEIFLPPGELDVELGREIFVDGIDAGLGGALNSASVARALGISTTLAHPSGQGPTDAAVIAERERLGIGAHTWICSDDPAISLVRSEAGERSFISCADLNALGACPPLDDFGWIHVPGLEEAHQLSEQLHHARKAGATISVCGSWAPARLDALSSIASPRWDLLVLNGAESRRATGGAESLEQRIEALTGTARDIIVTDGPRAIHALIDGQRLDLEVPPVESFVDATGAGDSLAAGYIAARIHGHDPHRALALGVEVARVVVGMRGGLIRDPSRFDLIFDRQPSAASKRET